MTEYVPEQRLFANEVVEMTPPLQVYLYGDAPPVARAVAVPSQELLHKGGVDAGIVAPTPGVFAIVTTEIVVHAFASVIVTV